MLKKLYCLVLLCSAATLAHADPFASGDAKIGRQMVEKHCITCHASSFGGDGSGIYTREDRIVKNAKGLIAQIRNCNTNLGLKWFEDEEMNVASYLNQNYYKFEK
ncbi:green heme protein [mine drainage metagenome]|uniref:Green heme protein n=1 Tax=mine drainage metagenome TaxID=410659 RepID=A0A1J5QTA8_9ZZZZ